MFLRFFAISTNLGVTVAKCWDSTWNPTLAGALSDQRVEELLLMQQSLLHKQPQSGAQDGWVWIGAQFSVRGHTRDYVRGIMRRTY